MKVYKWEYGDISTNDDGTKNCGWFPTDAIFPGEPERDLEAEQAEWERILEETKDLPDIPL